MDDVIFTCNVPSSAGVGGHKDHPNWRRAEWADIREFGIASEDLGFDAVSFPDHLTIAEGTTFECYSTLSALAVHTSSVKLYPKVTNVLFRKPSLLAKIGSTLDVISNGRLKMGVGAGWLSEEMRSYGYTWPDPPERIKRMEEAIEIMKSLWTDHRTTYEGEFYRTVDAECRPQPVQDPRPPIAVGGGGEQITLPVVAKHADSWNWFGDFEEWRLKSAVLDEYCEEFGRTQDSIERSWFGRIIIRESEAEVERIVDAVEMFDDIETAKSEHLVGTPSQISERIEYMVDQGVDEIVVEFVDIPEHQGIELFSDEVISQF